MACRKGSSFLEPPSLANPRIETQVSQERGMPQWPTTKGAAMTCRKGSRNVQQRVFLPRALTTPPSPRIENTGFARACRNGIPRREPQWRAAKGCPS